MSIDIQKTNLAIVAGGMIVAACSSPSQEASSNENTDASKTTQPAKAPAVTLKDDQEADKKALKDLGFAAILYMADADDVYPNSNNWYDSIQKYTKMPNSKRSGSEAGGFAFNSNLSGASMTQVTFYDKTPLIFASTSTEPNASDPLESVYFYSDGSTLLTNTDGKESTLKSGSEVVIDPQGVKKKVLNSK
jgi:hypothetical protein